MGWGGLARRSLNSACPVPTGLGRAAGAERVPEAREQASEVPDGMPELW